jgi:hypothetical protein
MFWALDMDDFKHGYPLISAVAKRYIKCGRERARPQAAW